MESLNIEERVQLAQRILDKNILNNTETLHLNKFIQTKRTTDTVTLILYQYHNF